MPDNVVGSAKITIEADASGFQASLDQQVRDAIANVEKSVKLDVTINAKPGESGGGTSERPSSVDDSNLSSVAGIEGRQSGSGTYDINFNIGDIRGAIERALEAPFVVKFKAEQIDDTSRREAPAAAPNEGPTAGRSVPQEVVEAMRRIPTLHGSLMELHKSITAATASTPHPFSSLDPNEDGNDVRRVGELISYLGKDVAKWVQITPNAEGRGEYTGTLKERLIEAGVPAEARKPIIEQTEPLTNARAVWGQVPRPDGSPSQHTGGAFFQTSDGTAAGRPSFAQTVANAQFTSGTSAADVEWYKNHDQGVPPAAQPLERVRPGNLADLQAAAARTSQYTGADLPSLEELHGGDEPRGQSREDLLADRKAFAETVKSVRFGEGIAQPGPYTGTYQRPPGEEFEEEQRTLTPAEKAAARLARRRLTDHARNPLSSDSRYYEQRQASDERDRALLETSREGTSRYGVGPDVVGDRSGGRPVLEGGPTPGRDPGRRRSPDLSEAGRLQGLLRGSLEENLRRGRPAGVIGRIADLEGLVGQPGGPAAEDLAGLRAQRSQLELLLGSASPSSVEVGPNITSLNDPALTAQQEADQRKGHGDLVQGGGGGRARGPGISSRSKAQVDIYSDARLKAERQGIQVDLAPFVREVQRGGSSPWFGLASGEGGAFQIPAVEEGEDLPYGEILAREEKIRKLASSKKPFELPGVSEVSGKVVPLGKKEAILRMAQNQASGGSPAAPGGDPATRDLVAEIVREADTAINAALSANLPGPNASFSGDTAVRSSNPQRQARLDLDLQEQLHKQRLAEERAVKYHNLQDDIDPVSGARAGNVDQDRTERLYQKAEADAIAAANRAEQLWAMGAQPITGTAADAQRMGRVDTHIGTLTRPIVEEGQYAEAYGQGRGRYGAAAGSQVPRLQGAEARRGLADFFELPSIAFDEGAGAVQISKAEKLQMDEVLTKSMMGPYAEKMRTAEHVAVPDVGAKKTDPVTGAIVDNPDAMRPETLYELSKRIWAEVVDPITKVLDDIPKTDKRGQQVKRAMTHQLDEFHNDLFGTIKFLDESNDELETRREMTSNRPGGRTVARNAGAARGVAPGGRGASARDLERSRVSTFFQQAQIPFTSLDEELLDAVSKRDEIRAKLPTYVTDPSSLLPEQRAPNSENERIRTAGLAKMREDIPLPNVNAIRMQVQDLVQEVMGEIGGEPSGGDVSKAIAERPDVDERVRKEALEVLKLRAPGHLYSQMGQGGRVHDIQYVDGKPMTVTATDAKGDPLPGAVTPLTHTTPGRMFVSPVTRNSSLAFEQGNDLRRGRINRDGTLVGAPPEPLSGGDLQGTMFPPPQDWRVRGAEEIAARTAEIDERRQKLSDERTSILQTPGSMGTMGIGLRKRLEEIDLEEAALFDERSNLGVPRPVEGPPASGTAFGSAAAAAAAGGAAAGGAAGGPPPRDRTAAGGDDRIPTGGIIRVWVENQLLQVAIQGGVGSGPGGTPADADEAAGIARGRSAQSRADLAYGTSKRSEQFVQGKIDAWRLEGLSDSQIRSRFKGNPLAGMADSYMNTGETGGSGGYGSAASGGSGTERIRRRLGMPAESTRDEEYYAEVDEGDARRSQLSAKARKAERGIPKRGFTASVTDIFSNIGGFLDKQVASVTRYQAEGVELASALRRGPKVKKTMASREEELTGIDAQMAELREIKDNLPVITKAEEKAGATGLTVAQIKAYDQAIGELGGQHERATTLVERARKGLVEYEAELKFQEERVDQAEENLPDGGQRAVAFGIGAIGAAGSVAVGMAINQAVMKLMGVLAEQLGPTIDETADRMLGFANTTAKVGVALGEATLKAGGNVGLATSEAAYAAAMGSDLYANIAPALEKRAALTAGSKAMVVQTDLARAGLNEGKKSENDFQTGPFQPYGGIAGLTRSTGGVMGTDLGSDSDILLAMSRMMPGGNGTEVQGWQQATPVLQDVLKLSQIYDDIMAPAMMRFTRLIPDDETNAQFGAMIKSWNQDLDQGGSSLRLFTWATKEQIEATDKALENVGAGDEIRKRWRDLRIGISDDGTPLTKEQVEAGGKEVGTDLLTAIGIGQGIPDSKTFFEGQEHSLEVQIDSMRRQSELAQKARQANFGMNFLANPPIPVSTQLFGAQAIGSVLPGPPAPAPAGGIPSIMSSEVPQAALDSWARLEKIATPTLAEINMRAKEGIERLKDYGLNDEQIAKIKAYGDEIKGLQTYNIGRQAAAGFEDYNRSLQLGKRQLGDMLGLTGQLSAQVRDVGEVQSTNLGVQERSVMLKGRELTLLGQELQQRQISFQTSLAGFQSQGLTPEEIAARQDQAKYVADISQRQLNLQKDITLTGFKIVDETNLRSLEQAMFDLDKFQRDYIIAFEVRGNDAVIAQITQLKEDTVAEAGIVVGEFQGIESAMISMAASVAIASKESFDTVFTNATKAIGDVADEYARMLSVVYQGGDYVPEASRRDDSYDPNNGGRGFGEDTGGPGPTGSFSGVGFSPTVHINVGSVGSQTDVDDIVRAVERALNQKSSLYGLRAPVAS